MKTNEKRIHECEVATSRMVQLLYNVPDAANKLKKRVKSYIHMQDRLFVMNFFIKKRVELENIYNLTSQLKGVVLKQFQKTAWMRASSWFGFD
ncbi:hypothetical protein PENTCL1PPCAC_21662, partial [Pristionchus entomophagus]